MALILRAPGHVWASHRAAARLWGLEGMLDDVVEVTTVANVRSPNAVVHVVASLASKDGRVRNGIPLTSVERTLVDLGRCVLPSRLEVAAIDALRRGLTTMTRLKGKVLETATRGRSGPRQLRRVLERWDDSAPPESTLEAQFQQLLRRHRLSLAAPQHEVLVQGQVVARIDFAYPDRLIGIEVDGYRWHGGDPAKWRGDLRRANALTALGWRVLRFTWDDVQRSPAEVARTIRRALLSKPSAERKETTKEAAT